jgi:hypothetical protein
LLKICPLDSLDIANSSSLPSPVYLPVNLQYRKVRLCDWDFTDLSFGVFDADTLVAKCIISAGHGPDDQRTIDAFGIPFITVFVTGSIDVQRAADAMMEKHFAHLMNDYAGYSADHLVCDSQFPKIAQSMLRNGAGMDTSFNVVIDGTRSVERLFLDVRKGYKCLIRKGNRTMDIDLLHSGNVSWDEFNEFRLLHIRESKRETRSIDTWKRHCEMVAAGFAFVVRARISHDLVGAALFLHNNEVCYYGVGAYDRSLFPKPISHAVLWQGILFAKQIGCASIEVGETFFSGVSTGTEKEFNIGEFKRGFGGNIIPRFRIKCVI